MSVNIPSGAKQRLPLQMRLVTADASGPGCTDITHLESESVPECRLRANLLFLQGCSMLNGGPRKICSTRTAECDFIWNKGLCGYNKGKYLEVRSFRIRTDLKYDS